MTTYRPALHKAIRYIEGFIESNELVAGDTLPPGVELARKAGVSPVTIWKAFGELQGRGVISVSRSSRARVAEPFQRRPEEVSTPASEASSRYVPVKQVWRRVKEQIEKDILTGVFRPGMTLPSQKELRYRYGVSFRTLSKALRQTVAEGLCVRAGRNYAVVPIVASHSRSRIVLMGTHDKYTNTVDMGVLGQELLRKLEEECSSHNTVLELVTVRLENDGTVGCFSCSGNRPFSLASNEGVLGYLVLMPGPGPVWEVLFRSLARLKRPVAVLDQADMAAEADSYVPERLPVRIFSLAGFSVASRRIARYLISLNHYRTAFISCLHGYPWSRLRLYYLEETYRDADIPRGVTPFVCEKTVDDFRRSGFGKWDMHSFLESYETMKDAVGLTGESHLDPLVKNTTHNLIVGSAYYESLEPLFRQALADTSITAWVVANDRTALYAFDFLGQRGVRIPGRISVISYDNSSESLVNNLTSYSFNTSGIAHAMIFHCLYPRQFKRKRTDRCREIEGLIIERRSTGTASAPQTSRKNPTS